MLKKYTFIACSTILSLTVLAENAKAQLFVPDRIFLFEGFHNIPGTTITPDFSIFQTIPIPDPFVVEETNIFASSPPVNEEGGAFERNEYLARFKKAGEPAIHNFGHRFQRSEAWDFSFDFKIESSHPEVRKEAGLYFEHNSGLSQQGNAIFNVASNDTFYTDGAGQIEVIFAPKIPAFSFSSIPGPLGDYNLNGTVDAADYTIWRDTEGSIEDFRANGNNEGASQDFIDQADYDTWKNAFGEMAMGEEVGYTPGETINIRLIYTPPIIDENIPFDGNTPDANVITPGTMEYIITPADNITRTSGPLPFEGVWKGIPNDTLISARVQNLSTASVAPDDSKVTFSNWDFNGDLPGSGLPGSGAGLAASGVPEPSAVVMAVMGLAAAAVFRRRS